MQGVHREQHQKQDPGRKALSRSYLWSDGRDGQSAEAQENGRHSRSTAKLRQRNEALLLVNQWGQEMATTLDPKQVADQLLRKVTQIIDAEGASLWLREDEEGDQLICRSAADGHAPSRLVDMRLDSSQGIVGQVVETGKSIITHDVLDNPFFFAEIDRQIGFNTHSLMAVPLQVRGKVIGVLEIVNKKSGCFDADDLMLVEILAASAAIALDNARLVKTLQARAAELKAHNQELDAFAHTTAHDLKAPLSLIIGFADLVHRYHDTMSQEELLSHLHTIVRSGRKMSSIIEELLLLAGVRRRAKVELEPLDMASIIGEAEQRLLYMLTEHKAQIIKPDRWPLALGYAPWVEEVWINYISNAIKYGGEPPRVELGWEATKTDGMWRFWVRDNGAGLTQEEQERLFKPFTQLNVRTKGHGLGLSIVQRIVTKLGGEVAIQSQVNQGSTFYFTLPAVLDSVPSDVLQQAETAEKK
jgi:signal transduction histidine kinase